MPKLSPMMQQYIEIKEAHKDDILFFRLGDFYEMFFEDAKLVSRELELTLTGKNCGLEERAPMCGVPFHSADTYIARLVEKGYRVAICEQTEDPASAKGLVRREVVQIITPGTVLSSSMLRESENNYIASVHVSVYGAGDRSAGQNRRDGSLMAAGDSGSTAEMGIGLAYCDISTGELCVTDLHGAGAETALQDELVKINASEILFSEETGQRLDMEALKANTSACLNCAEDAFYRPQAMRQAICRQFHTDSLQGLGLAEDSPSEAALGSLLLYIHDTQKNDVSHITRPRIYTTGEHMSLDKATIRNLELTETLFEKKLSGSLLGVLDKTHTAMGSRLMKQWIRTPLNETGRIRARLDAVDELVRDPLLRNDLKEELKKIYDFERLTGRIATGKANGRDLIALRNSCASLPEIKRLISGCESQLLQDLEQKICSLEDIHDLIDASIVEEPPFTVKEGGLIREGFSEELDELKLSIRDAQSWIASLESKERERTGIKNLKVGFNKVFGYYLEVTKSAYDLVPDDYIRKQTLVGSERFVTPQLKETERKVLNAETEINKMEYELFSRIRSTLQSRTPEIQQTSGAISRLDVLVSFAHVSDQNDYVKPAVDEGDEISIRRGRHPVIEQTIQDGQFVSNETYIDRSDASMLIITGPNMSGKSTYMRQTALIVLMAQSGCFVPAEAARIGICDRIFTRIGASDNLAQGQSTFYVEMSELSYILNTATEKSLVILDEIGRGTSTYDGLSIAWATAEYLSRPQRRVRTLFATHYHEMTVLEKTLHGVRNLNVDVAEENGNVIFLHKIVEGSASRSYGIHVAKLAGAPAELLETAQMHLDALSGDQKENAAAVAWESAAWNQGITGKSRADAAPPGMNADPEGTVPVDGKGGISGEKTSDPSAASFSPSKGEEQLSLFTQIPDPKYDSVIHRIRELDLMETTPSQALRILEELKEYL